MSNFACEECGALWGDRGHNYVRVGNKSYQQCGTCKKWFDTRLDEDVVRDDKSNENEVKDK